MGEYVRQIPWGQGESGLVRLPDAGEPAIEIARASSSVPGPWIVSVGPAENGSTRGLENAVAILEWGWGRARFTTEVDLGQTFCVQAGFVRVSVRTDASGPDTPVACFIAPTTSGTANAEGPRRTVPAILAPISDALNFGLFDIPAFAVFLEDPAGFEAGAFCPALLGPVSLGDRRYTFFSGGTPNVITGFASVAAGERGRVAIPRSARQVAVLLAEPTLSFVLSELSFILSLC